MPIPSGALTVDAVSQAAVMTIIVDTTGMPAGTLLVWGESDSRSWWVRGARGGTPFTPGDVFFLTDPLAPINTPIRYHVESPNGEVASSSTTTRAYTGRHLLTDLSGRGHTDFRWRPTDDRWTPGLRNAQFTIPGADRPVVRYDTSTDGDGVVPAETTGADTVAMRVLVKAGAPVILHHNEGICRVLDCDTPRVQLVLLRTAPAGRSGPLDRARRLWDCTFTLVGDPLADQITPRSTWADFDAYWDGFTWADHDAEWGGRSWVEHARVEWSA